MWKKKGIFAILSFVAVLIFTGCSANNASASQTKKITIIAKDMAFQPNEVTVEKGTKVKLTLKNEEMDTNNLVLQGTDIVIDQVAPGEEKTVEFIADRQGTFEMRSTVNNMGSMSGKFIVK